MKIIMIIFLILNSILGKNLERKLMFTPYLSAFEDYSSKPVNEKPVESNPYLAATHVGENIKNDSSIMPGGFAGDINNAG